MKDIVVFFLCLHWALLVPQKAFAQFHFLKEEGKITLIDFAGKPDKFDLWISSKEGAEARKSINTFYTRYSCNRNLISYLRQCSKIDIVWLGISPDSAEVEDGAIRELNGLSTLRELRLCTSSKLSGEFSQVRGLDSLEILDIDGKAKLSQADLEAIGNYRNLINLSVRCERVDSFTWLKNLTNLEILSLVADEIPAELIPALSELPHLKSIQIYGVGFGEEELVKLSKVHGGNLMSLALELKKSSDIDAMRNFPNLRAVNIRTRDRGATDFRFVSQLPKLRLLYTSGWEIAGDNLTTLESYISLEQVRVEFNNEVLENWIRTQDKRN